LVTCLLSRYTALRIILAGNLSEQVPFLGSGELHQRGVNTDWAVTTAGSARGPRFTLVEQYL
jgi:hypothetical protein